MSDDIRKSQITGTFGVGSLRVQLGGLSMIAAGLDHWYQDYTLTRQMQNSRVDKKAFKIFESRLQSYLDVDYFMEPPVFIDSNTYHKVFLLHIKTTLQLFPTIMQRTNHFYWFRSTPTIQKQTLLQINQTQEEQRIQKSIGGKN